MTLALVILLGCLWGLHFSLIKICSESGIPAAAIAFYSTCGVAFIFAAISGGRRRWPRLTRRHLLFYALCGLFGYLIAIFVELLVAKHMDAGLLTLIVSTTPFFTLVFALVNRTEPVGPRRIAGVAVGCLAMVTLLLPQTAISTRILGWIGLTFIVPVSYGIYHNYVASRWPAGSDIWQVASGEMLVAVVLLLPLFVVFGEPANAPLVGATPWRDVYWVILLMIVFAALEVFLYFTIIQRAGAVIVSLSNFVTIAAGVVWGMIIFGERPGLWSWLSVAVLMLALALVIDWNREARQDR